MVPLIPKDYANLHHLNGMPAAFPGAKPAFAAQSQDENQNGADDVNGDRHLRLT
jgi:hypothetical protein